VAAGRRVAPGEQRALRSELCRWRRRCVGALPFDVLVAPTLQALPLRAQEDLAAFRAQILRDLWPFNALGWPAITTRDGLMLAGPREQVVLAAALAWEEELEEPVSTC
jgi:Asp-tRNA(Asn)/Glu-tRNA(Gln) amidotransferase A subunit family amidase